MATAFKRSLKEFIHDCSCGLVVDEATWHNQYVGIVMLTAEMGNLRNPCESGANTLMLVERDADTLATAAYRNAWIYLTALNGLAQGMAKVGIIATHVAICTEILVGITMLFQVLEYIFL